jgi:hypothetical protein
VLASPRPALHINMPSAHSARVLWGSAEAKEQAQIEGWDLPEPWAPGVQGW